MTPYEVTMPQIIDISLHLEEKIVQLERVKTTNMKYKYKNMFGF